VAQRGRKQTVPAGHVTASSVGIHPDAETGQELSNYRPTSLGLLDSDPTNASPPADKGDSGRYAQTPAALADKHLLSKMDPEFIPFLLLLFAILAIAVISDYKGRLGTGPALLHFVWQSATISLITVAVLFAYFGYAKIMRWLKRKDGEGR